jgi:HK97 family phage major capsid protein
MAYDNITSRAKIQPLVPEDVSNSMLGRNGGVRNNSAVLQTFKHVPVAQIQTRFPILSALPIAYWVTGDTGLKQTTEMAWANKYMNIEEIACIVPIPDNVLDDTEFDIWGEFQPDIEEAIGRALDAAVLFGVNAPATFPVNVSLAASNAGNTYNEQAAAAAGGVADDLDAVIGLVETDGFDVTGIMAALNLRGRLRRARNTLGNRIEDVDANVTSYAGMPIAYPTRGLFPAGGGTNTNLRALVGDWQEFVVGVRKDISMKILDQAVIQDETGAIIYNLAQQDMIALRFTFRAGWQVSNRINWDQPVEANRYPVGRLMY